MRIITGFLKGRNIIVPNTSTIEPVKEQVRNSIFSILEDKVTNASCLDLYAGSGSLGLEALSRGADHCVFVDQDEECVLAIKENLNYLNLLEKGDVIRDNVTHFVKRASNEKFSIVFLDPPYVTPTTHLLKSLVPLLQTGGFVVYLCDCDHKATDIAGLDVVTERCYGKTKVIIYDSTT